MIRNTYPKVKRKPTPKVKRRAISTISKSKVPRVSKRAIRSRTTSEIQRGSSANLTLEEVRTRMLAKLKAAREGKYTPVMNNEELREYGLGGLIGTGVGATAGTIIPGVGTAVGAQVGGMLGTGIEGLLQKEEDETNQRKTLTRSTGSLGYKYGGKMKYKYANGGNIPGVTQMGNGATKYNGPKHEQGGIPIDDMGNPTIPQNATAEVEGGETRDQDYIFSDSLKVPNTNKTFAEAHEQMVKNGANPEHIERLKLLQERTQEREGVKGGDEMEYGGKYDNGGNFLEKNKKFGEALNNFAPEPKANPMAKSDWGKALDVASYVLPSAMKAGIALSSPSVKPTPKIKANKVPVQSRAFTEGKRTLTKQYRSILADPNATANQKLLAQSQLGEARSNLAGKEADYRSRQEQTNAQLQQRADMSNQRAAIQDREAIAAEEGARKTLLMDAVTSPINTLRKDRAGARSQIANILTSANQIKDRTDRANSIRTSLRAMGLSAEEIEQIISENNV